jgi:hypothetical protein
MVVNSTRFVGTSASNPGCSSASPFSGTGPRHIGGSIGQPAIPAADLVTSSEADAVNVGLCADGPAVHVDRDDAHAFGPLGGVGGADRVCASATWTELRGCCP